MPLLLMAPAACGTPPELRELAATPTGVRSGSPTTAAPTTAPTTPPTVLPGALPPSPTTDPGTVAVECRTGPSRAQVVDLVRGRSGVLPADARVRVRTGPLCAADWQYTVLAVTGYEPLQVVTRTRSGVPRLVTAGTDVCIVEVRVAAPPGIRTLACEGDPGVGAGA
nr:hypothetical protein [Micromonospora nigra]